MPNKWTKAQSAAITDNGGSLLLSAAAGSGKTAVLVERVVRLLTDAQHSTAPDRLLIVTFTNAAAAQLRARISARLSQEIAAHPSPFLQRQRLLLGRASICTIDAFCLQLLQRHFNEIDGLAPDFHVADDATLYTLRNAALAQAMEEMYTDANFIAFAGLYGRSRSDDAAGDAVLQLYNAVRSGPWPLQRLRALPAMYADKKPLTDTVWGTAQLAAAQEAVAAAQQLLRAAAMLVDGEEALAPYAATLESDGAFLQGVQKSITAKNWDEAYARVQAYNAQPLGTVRGFDAPVKEQVKSLREEVKGLITDTLQKKIFLCTAAEYAQDRDTAAPLVGALVRATEKFYTLYFAARMQEKALEFSDFEHLALQLLCTETGQKTPLAHTIAAGFDAVMVDEYQDTNHLQEQLYTCLANEDGSNLFCVGDLKQSIYRFRQASPEIFLAKKQAYSPYNAADYPAVLTLGHNFRSAGNIIEQVNYFFAQLMRPALGGVAYAGGEMLVKGTQSEYDGGALELKIVDTDGAAAPEGDALCVAQTIKSMVDSGYAVRSGDSVRPCNYGDFCVLLRTRGSFALYENVLAAHGVPVFADTQDSWLTSVEVTSLVNLLYVIDNPADEVHLAGAMLSPLVRLTPTHMAAVRAGARGMGFYAAVLRSTDADVQAFVKDVAHFRTLAATLSVEDLCTEILSVTHYMALAGAMPEGTARRENLRRFVRFAAEYASAGNGTLAGFLRRVDSCLAGGVKESAAAPQTPLNTVSIMTIHRSKGLEYPVVILADAAHRFNNMDLRSRVLYQRSMGLGLSLRCGMGDIYPTLPHRAIALCLQREAAAEEMRTLYVALTRAQDKLIITMPLKKPAQTLGGIALRLAAENGASDNFLCGAGGFDTWILAAALQHPDCDTLRAAAGWAQLPTLPTASRIQAQIVPFAATEQAQAAQYSLTAAPNAALVQALTAGFAWQYPHTARTLLPVKRSVSALAHTEDTPVLERPSFMYKQGLTAAEQGTALHAFLQYASFAGAAQDLTAETARLVQQGYLEADLAAALPQAAVQTFLKTPLAARIAAADAVLRETEFITAIPARQLPEGQNANEQDTVLVQGVADLVLLKNGTAQLVDYKTDAHKTPQQFIEAYSAQLALYKAAMEKRLAMPVTQCSLYAFSLGQEIILPL